VAMTVLLVDVSDAELCLRQELLAQLARLGVTRVEVVRDEQTLGIVLEGWMFDPESSAEAAAAAVGTTPAVRTLRPVVHLTVAAAAAEGGMRG
jgi:hypothetical protein